MIKEISFTEKVLGAFKNVDKEIDKGSSEHDVRYRFVKYFVESVLGYEPKYIKWEKKRADLTIIDENDFAVIKIETKKPTESFWMSVESDTAPGFQFPLFSSWEILENRQSSSSTPT